MIIRYCKTLLSTPMFCGRASSHVPVCLLPGVLWVSDLFSPWCPLGEHPQWCPGLFLHWCPVGERSVISSPMSCWSLIALLSFKGEWSVLSVSSKVSCGCPELLPLPPVSRGWVYSQFTVCLPTVHQEGENNLSFSSLVSHGWASSLVFSSVASSLMSCG